MIFATTTYIFLFLNFIIIYSHNKIVRVLTSPNTPNNDTSCNKYSRNVLCSSLVTVITTLIRTNQRFSKNIDGIRGLPQLLLPQGLRFSGDTYNINSISKNILAKFVFKILFYSTQTEKISCLCKG